MSHWPRQQPGIACEECRKRKLRCDRQRPCATCANSGLVCEVNTECLPRGPKKGTLKALKNRIQSLEKQLVQTDIQGTQRDQFANRTTDRDTQGETLKRDREQSQCSNSSNGGEAYEQNPQVFKTPVGGQGEFLTELMRADLDQLYFDRVHAAVPIIHKYRYFASLRDPNLQRSRVCLRNAMWTLAMSHSSQFENMREILYNETRQMLEEVDLGDKNTNTVHTEHLQAWILITYYEFLRSSYQRAWFSAGRVFRLVQLLRLHELDSPTSYLLVLSVQGGENDEIETEEKRRAFWVAYCLDRFISVQNGLPLTLNEEVTCTRLPCLEVDFENGQATQFFSLSEAIASSDNTLLSPLAECVVLVTLHGRALSHFQISTVEQYYGSTTEDFWIRHEWIDSKLKDRAETFSLKYPTVSLFAEPMLLLVFMVLQATKLYLYKIMESMSVDEVSAAKVLDYQTQAINAAKEIANLTKKQAHVGYFNGYIFMPIAIFLGAERLIIQRDANMLNIEFLDDPSIREGLNGCFEMLRKIQGVNNLAKYYLNLLDSGDLRNSRPLQLEIIPD